MQRVRGPFPRISRALGLLVISALWSCSDPAPPTVTGAPAAIVISAPTDSLTFLGATQQVTARVTTEDGSVLSDPLVSWTSADPSVLTADASGLVTAVSVGSATVIGEIDGLTDSLSIDVVQVPALVTILPEVRRFESIGDTAQYEVVLSDQGGTDIPGTVAVWSTPDTSVVSLSPAGRLETVGNGYAHAEVEVGGVVLGVDFVVAAPVVFRGTNVVDMLGPSPLVDHDVLVEAGLVTALGPTGSLSVPPGAFEVDASGRYLMPGLTDMHIHMTCETRRGCANDLFLYLANGVTTVRTMWGGAFQLRARDEIAAGVRVGPTMFVASPGLDGAGGDFTAFTDPILSPAQARTTVRTYAEAGYDFIKAYNRISDAIYIAMHEEATAAGIRVLGHKPFAVTSGRIFSLGHWTSEHLLTYEQEASPTGSMWTSEPNLPAVRVIAAAAAVAGTAETPTTSPFVSVASEVSTSEEARYTSPGVIAFSTDVLPAFNVGTAQRAERIRRQRDVVGTLHDEGVPILLGTDAGVRWVLPGFSIQGELEELVAAGLTSFEALEAGTVTAARYLEAEGEFGVISVGARADLVLLEADPLVDVANVGRRLGVMAQGIWITDRDITNRLEAIAAEYGR